MNVKIYNYLKTNKIKIKDFCSQLGISRTSFYYYTMGLHPTPKAIILAVAYLTKDQITQKDWQNESF